MRGTHSGTVLELTDLTHRLQPFENKPHAQKLMDVDGASITLIEFAAGQTFREHHSVHPITVQALKGTVKFTVKEEEITLTPGTLIHLTDHLLHELIAVDPATILVTMLTGEKHPEPQINSEVRSI